MALSDRLLQEKLDKESRGGRNSGLWGSRSRKRARGREARVSLLEDEDVPNSCPSIESERGVATGVMAPEIDVSMSAPLAAVALRSDFLANEDSVEEEHDSLLMELNRFKVENEQFRKLILVTKAAMKAISTCLVDMEIEVATIKT